MVIYAGIIEPRVRKGLFPDLRGRGLTSVSEIIRNMERGIENGWGLETFYYLLHLLRLQG